MCAVPYALLSDLWGGPNTIHVKKGLNVFILQGKISKTLPH